MTEEIWAKVENIPRYGDFPNYEVSNLGRLRRGTRLLSGHSDYRGAVKVQIRRDGRAFSILLHRIVASVFCVRPPFKPEVNHIDGVPANNCASNLEWVSQEENLNHAIKHIFTPRIGEQIGTAILTESSAKQLIVDLAETDISIENLAEKYGVTEHTVMNVARNVAWKHIPRPDNFDYKTKRRWGRRKLTNSQIIEVYCLKDSGKTQREVAADFGITQSNVGSIWSGYYCSKITGAVHRAGTIQKTEKEHVLEIASWQGFYSARELVDVFGVSEQTIRRIWSGERWGKLTGITPIEETKKEKMSQAQKQRRAIERANAMESKVA